MFTGYFAIIYWSLVIAGWALVFWLLRNGKRSQASVIPSTIPELLSLAAHRVKLFPCRSWLKLYSDVIFTGEVCFWFHLDWSANGGQNVSKISSRTFKLSDDFSHIKQLLEKLLADAEQIQTGGK